MTIKSLEIIEAALRDMYIDRDAPEIFKHIQIVRDELEYRTVSGIDAADIEQYFEDQGLPPPSKERIKEILDICEDAYDHSGSGLHGYELIEYAVEEQD